MGPHMLHAPETGSGVAESPFVVALQHCAMHPEKWTLSAKELGGPGLLEDLEFPFTGTLEDLLRARGASGGRWVVSIDSSAEREGTRKSAHKRITAAGGKRRVVLALSDREPPSNPTVGPGARAGRAPGGAMTPEELAARAAQADAQRRRAELESLRVEAEMRRLQREMEGHAGGGAKSFELEIVRELAELKARLAHPPPAAPRNDTTAAIIAAIVPLVTPMLEGFVELVRDRTHGGGGGEVAGPADALGSLLPLLERLIGFAQGLGGGAGDAAPRGAIGEAAELLQAVVAARNTAPTAAAESAPAPRPNGTQQQQRRGSQMNPQQEERARVVGFVTLLSRELAIESDAHASAARLGEVFDSCPKSFRELVVAIDTEPGSQDLLGKIPALARWLPSPQVDALTAAAQQPTKREWILNFVDGLKDEEDDPGEFERGAAGED